MYKIILIFIAIFLVGCSPRYITKNQYVPSSNAGFSQCLNKYEQEKIICNQDCRADYQICLDGAYKRSEKIYEAKFVKYTLSYEDYLFEHSNYKTYKYKFDKKHRRIKNDYNYFLNECKKKKGSFTCRRKNELKNSLENMKRAKLRRPRAPMKPSFNVILRKQQNFCNSDCDCSKNFDIGYENCGGQVILHRYCVENCD